MMIQKKERLMTPDQVFHVFGRVIKDCNVYQVVTVGAKGKEKHYSYVMKPNDRFVV